MNFCQSSAQLSHTCDETSANCGSLFGRVDTPLTCFAEPINNGQSLGGHCGNRNGEEEEEGEGGGGFEEMNLFSEASRETLCGSTNLSQDISVDCTTFTSNNEKSHEDSKVEREKTQLSAENILQMQQMLASGYVPLKAELLSTNTMYHKKLFGKEKSESVVTLFPETEPENMDSFTKQQSFDSQFAPAHCEIPRNSFSATQLLWSVDSVCSSSVAPNILNRKNLDLLSCQLRFAPSTLRSELLATDAVLDLERTFGTVANDTIVSVCVEGGSELKADSEFQSDFTGTCEEVKKNNYFKSPSETSCNQLCDKNQHLSCGEKNGAEKRLKTTMPPKHQKQTRKICSNKKLMHRGNSQADLTDVLSSFTFPVDSQAQVCGLLPSELSANDFCEKNNPKKCGKATDAHGDMRHCKGECDNKKTARLSSEVCNVLNIYYQLTEEIEDIKKQMQFGDTKTIEIHATVEKKLYKIEKRIAELKEVINLALSSRSDVLTQTLKDEVMKTVKKYCKEHMDEAFLRQIVDQVRLVDQVSRSVLSNQNLLQNRYEERLLQQEDDEQQQEGLFSAEGTFNVVKIRLIVEICFPNMHCEILLPISSNATVGMCKREILRRLSQQCLIDSSFSSSGLFLLQGSAVLFDDDKLVDVFGPTLPLQNSAVANNFVKLTLSTFSLKPCCTICNTPLRTVTKKQSPQKEKEGEEVNLFKADVGTDLVSTITTTPTMGDYGRNTFGNNNNNNVSLDTVAANFLGKSDEKKTVLRPNSITDLFLEKKEDYGHLQVEAVSELFQNESLHRRLVCELERIERGQLFKDENMRRSAILNRELNFGRLLLLHHVVHSSVEEHRSLARNALWQLDAALTPGASLEEMTTAGSAARAVIHRIVPPTDAAHSEVTDFFTPVNSQK